MRQGRNHLSGPDAFGGQDQAKFHHSMVMIGDEVAQRRSPRAMALGEAFVTGPTPEILEHFIPDPWSRPAAPLDRLVSSLLEDDLQTVGEIVADALERARDPQKVASDLLAPAALRFGEMWKNDECDFLRVTIAASRLHRLFNDMVRDLPPPSVARPDRCALLSPAPGEEHGFGLAIVEDALLRAGWSVDRCSRGSEDELADMASASDYRLIGLSVSGDRLLPRLASTIGRLRAVSLNRSVAVVGGGSLLLSDPESARIAGFDAVAPDAASAVRLAEQIARGQESETGCLAAG